MTDTKTKTLDDAVQAARSLPDEAQQALAQEIIERVEDFTTPDRSPERQAIVKERLSKKLEAVPREDLMAILRQYNPAL